MLVPPPSCLKKPLTFPNKLLMGPGPSNCPPRVLHALSLPILGHMHKETFQIMDEIKEGIKYVFQTENDFTLAITASGHAGMDSVMSNLVEPGDKVVIAVNGIWGLRASKMAENYGGKVYKMETALGNNFSLNEIEATIKREKPSLLLIVQGESSTGVHQPIENLGNLCHKYDCLLAVDTVASLGGVKFLMDEWEVDAAYTGSQKVLSAPPGITPISFSKRALKKIFERKTPSVVYYLDMSMLGKQWGCLGSERLYHHTVSSTLLCGLRESLALIVEEGLDNVIIRHENCASRLYEGLEKLGIELFVNDPKARLPTVTSIVIPNGIDWNKFLNNAMYQYNLELGGGLGPTAGKIGRIGLLGYNAHPENVDIILKVLKKEVETKSKL